MAPRYGPGGCCGGTTGLDHALKSSIYRRGHSLTGVSQQDGGEGLEVASSVSGLPEARVVGPQEVQRPHELSLARVRGQVQVRLQQACPLAIAAPVAL